MTDFQVVAILVSLTAGLAYVNARLLRLPSAIGMTSTALFASVLVLILDRIGITDVSDRATHLLTHVNLPYALLHGMLGLLLFAGALHVDLRDLRDHWRPIALLAAVGTVVSTILVGTMTYLVLAALGLDMAYGYCVVFGALISPTDPIAVLGVLKAAKVPKSLEITIAGESLFNDGVGVVIFLAVLGFATGSGADAGALVRLFLREAVGGIAFGLATGYIGYRLLRSIDDYIVEILITLALVLGGYVAAEEIHVSAPLAAVAAGLLIGNQGRELAMSDTTRRYVDTFWELIDEILNAMLFLLIGLEMVRLPISAGVLAAAAVIVPVVLGARVCAVALPLFAAPDYRRRTPEATALLTWGGLRGGISVALALSLPDGKERDTILVMTYAVVAFSILVQGLTLGRVVRRRLSRPSTVQTP